MNNAFSFNYGGFLKVDASRMDVVPGRLSTTSMLQDLLKILGIIILTDQILSL